MTTKLGSQQSLLNEVGYNAYVTYLALKRHFTSNYDYHKYNGKTRASFDSFITRKDAYFFQKIGRKYGIECANFILSNILENEKLWAGGLIDDESALVYSKWKGRQNAITHHISEQLSVFKEDFKENFTVTNSNQIPYIANLFLQKKISLETFTILSKLTKSDVYWKQNSLDHYIMPNLITKIGKYHPFLNYSETKIRESVKKHFF